MENKVLCTFLLNTTLSPQRQFRGFGKSGCLHPVSTVPLSEVQEIEVPHFKVTLASVKHRANQLPIVNKEGSEDTQGKVQKASPREWDLRSTLQNRLKIKSRVIENRFMCVYVSVPNIQP